MKFFNKKIAALSMAAVLSFSTVAFAEESSSVSVSLNGNTIAFDAVKPVIIDSKTYVHTQDFLKAIGAEVGETEASKGDVTVTFTTGENTLVLKENDKTTEIALDAADKSLVGVRALAEAMGYTVGWDEDTKSVILVNIDDILAPYADKFTIMDKFMQYSKQFAEKPYALTGTFNFDFTASDGETFIPITSTGTLEGLTDETSMELDMAMKVDIDDFINALSSQAGEMTEQDKAEIEEVKAMLENITIKFIFNMETGKYYLQSPLFETALGASDNTWIEIDFNDFFAASGLGSSYFTDLMKLSQTGDFLSIVKASATQYPANTATEAAAISQYVEMMASMLSDDAFTKEGNAYVQSMEETTDGLTFKMEITLDANEADEITGYQMTMSASGDGLSMEMASDMNAENKATSSFQISIAELINMAMNMEMQYTETTNTPASAPSDSDKIVSFTDIFM